MHMEAWMQNQANTCKHIVYIVQTHRIHLQHCVQHTKIVQAGMNIDSRREDLFMWFYTVSNMTNSNCNRFVFTLSSVLRKCEIHTL